MQTTLWQAIAEIRKGHPAPIYLVTGDAGRAADWILREILRAMSDAENDPPTVARFRGDEPIQAEQLGQAWGGDLFARRSIVFCRGFESLAAGQKAGSRDAELLTWIEMLLKTPPDAAVVLASRAEKLDERKKLAKSCIANRNVRVVDGNHHKKEEWRAIGEDILGRAVTLAPSQWDIIQRRCGENLDVFWSELQKLATYAIDKPKIEDRDLEAVLTHAEQASVFDVIRLVMNGKAAAAYSLLRSQQPDSTFAFFALLARQYRLISRIHADGQQSDSSLAQSLGVHPYACKVAREQARRISPRDCEQQIVLLEDLEFRVKSGRLSEDFALEMWFLRQLVA